ncbi:S-layer homology domain-containing protein [Paenibacillus sp. 1_12]|uniref:S-layer homology domain-containing protein n=1 Tax=Paenibacillus sp. 1_12 TaxID=1566278 RepID=UPI0008E56BCA|nr:S-layer homology domain-containing protein [Paenibacillus sp. 1_12]SFM29047.1 S-layer homology domain-containing protein [Paenibacillus sp. 1_12]
MYSNMLKRTVTLFLSGALFLTTALLATVPLANIVHADETFHGLTVTGFNQDLIANGAGLAKTSTTAAFDSSGYVMYSKDFDPIYGYGLPSDGIITSESSGVTYTLANYNGNNALLLVNQNEIGTLTLETPSGGYDSLSILTTSSEGSSELGVTLNFEDGTSYEVSSIGVPDWFSGDIAAIVGIGRVSRSDNQIKASSSNPRLYDRLVIVPKADKGKNVKSLTFKKTSAKGRSAIFAVAGKLYPNEAPIATAAEYSVMNNTALTGNLSATDADSDALTYRIASPPNKGTVSISVYGAVYGGNSFVYTPIAGAIGSDNFTFIVNDGMVDSNPATVSITLVPFKRANQPSDGGGGGGGSVTSIQPDVQVLLDGVVQEQSATAMNDTIGDQTFTIATVDNDKVIAKLEQESKKVLTIYVPGNSDVVVDVLNGKLVKVMEGKATSIEVKSDRGTLILPASEINIDNISAQLGSDVKLEDIQISIKIGLAVPTTAALINQSTIDGKITLVGAPITFEVAATWGGKTVNANQFKSYVGRQIILPVGTNTSQVTTGVVWNADGTLTHVPTKILTIDGKMTAIINSLTNSSYAVVLSPKTFADVETHWSKQDVVDMASRQVVQGVTDQVFQPDVAITRAEFIAIMVRALGLKADVGSEMPKDVQASDWYAGVVTTGVSYKLISGYEDGTFHPNQMITRREAAAIVARALTISKLNNGLAAEEITRQLEFFTDGPMVPAWAKNDLAVAVKNNILQGAEGKLSPNDNVTRAQSAAILRRMLQTANLINE